MELLTDAMASCSDGLGFLLEEEPKIRFMVGVEDEGELSVRSGGINSVLRGSVTAGVIDV